MAGYTKLFSSIVTSTIWREPKETKIMWITMLALATKDGIVEGSVPGMAAMAGLTLEESEAAINQLQSPDPYSRTSVQDGRRIEKVDGGWLLINHAKYRAMLSKEERRQYLTQKKRDERARQQMSTVVAGSSTESTQAEAEAKADTEEESDTSIASPPAPRERNLLFDALATATGLFLGEITKQCAGRIATALKEIKSASPDVTPEEIARRAANYRTHFRGVALTEMALAKHWALCRTAKGSEAPRRQYGVI